MDTDGRNTRKIASRSINALAWSPDGTRFVFRTIKTPGFMTAGDFKLADANGVVLGEIRRTGACESITWQPDNENILFAFSNRPKISNASTFSDRVPEDHELNTIAWSPDGRRKAYLVILEDSYDDYNTQLWISDADGTNGVKLTDRGVVARWSPDGKHIAYKVVHSVYDGDRETFIRNELWIADSDGNNRRKVVGIEPAEDSWAGLPYILTWLPAS